MIGGEIMPVKHLDAYFAREPADLPRSRNFMSLPKWRRIFLYYWNRRVIMLMGLLIWWVENQFGIYYWWFEMAPVMRSGIKMRISASKLLIISIDGRKASNVLAPQWNLKSFTIAFLDFAVKIDISKREQFDYYSHANEIFQVEKMTKCNSRSAISIGQLETILKRILCICSVNAQQDMQQFIDIS